MNVVGTERNRPHRATPDGSAPITYGRPQLCLTVAAQVAVGLVVGGIPWLFGGVYASAQCWLFMGVLVALACCLLVALQKDAPSPPVPLVLVPLALAILLGLLQLVPLSKERLGRVSQRGAELWQTLCSSASFEDAQEGRVAFDLGVIPATPRPTISLYPASTRRNVALLIAAAGIFFLGAFLFSGERQPIVLFSGVAAFAVAMAFFGIAQQLTGTDKIYGRVQPSQYSQIFASFVNRNHAGNYLNLGLAAAVGLAVWAFSRRQEVSASTVAAYLRSSARFHENVAARWAAKRLATAVALLAGFNAVKLSAGAALAMISAGVICSLSRGAWLATAAGVAVVGSALTASRRWRQGLWMFLLAGILGYAVTGWLARYDLVRDRVGALAQGSLVADGRVSHWRDGLHAAKDFLLAGSGLGTYRYVYRVYERSPNAGWFYHAENQYLETLVEGGVTGLALMLASICLVGLACYLLLQESPSSTSYACGIAGGFALASQAVHSFFDFGLSIPANMALFALLCGCVAGRAARLEYRHHRVRRRLSRRISSTLTRLPRTRPLAACCLATLVLGTAWGAAELRSASVVEEAMEAVRNARHEDKLQPARATLADAGALITRLGQALQHAPDDAEVQRQLARMWIHRYRVRALQIFRNGGAQEQPEELWNRTSPLQVHAWVRLLDRQHRLAELSAFRHAAEVQTDLANAVRHLLLARSACPLLADVHLLLAEIEPAVSPYSAEALHLGRVRRLAAANPGLLAECGLVEMQSGRLNEALMVWQRCLELDPGRDPYGAPLATWMLATITTGLWLVD